VAALICSIASFVVCPLLPAIVGLVLASQAKTKIRQSGGTLTGENLAQVATIVSWINIGLAVAATIAIIIIAIASDGNNTDSFDRLALLYGQR
jgi:hypothetical protein